MPAASASRTPTRSSGTSRRARRRSSSAAWSGWARSKLLESRGMAHPDSFGARSRARGRRARGRALPARRAAGAVRRPPAPVHAADPARERPPQRERRHGHRGRRRGGGGLGGRGRAVAGDLVHARTRAAPGLHRRPRDRRPRRDAERDGGPRRRGGAGSTRSCRPSSSSTTPSRWTSSRRRFAIHAQLGARVRAQPRALRVPALGPERVRQLQGRPARDRDRAPGEPRVPRARRGRAGGDRVSRTRCSGPTRTRR